MKQSCSTLLSISFVLIISACGGGGENTPEPEPVITITTSTYTEAVDGVKTEYLVTTTCTDGNCVDVSSVLGTTHLVTNDFELVVQYYNENTVDMAEMIKHTLPMGDARVKANDLTGLDLPVVAEGQDHPYGYYIRQYDGKIYVKFADENGRDGYRIFLTSWCKRAAPNSPDNYCFANLYNNNEMSPITYTIAGHIQIDFDILWQKYSNNYINTAVGISLYPPDYIDAPEQSWVEDMLPETFSAYLCIEATTGEVTQMSIDDVEFVPEARISCPKAT
jgi:hypothetical protein